MTPTLIYIDLLICSPNVPALATFGSSLVRPGVGGLSWQCRVASVVAAKTAEPPSANGRHTRDQTLTDQEITMDHYGSLWSTRKSLWQHCCGSSEEHNSTFWPSCPGTEKFPDLPFSKRGPQQCFDIAPVFVPLAELVLPT